VKTFFNVPDYPAVNRDALIAFRNQHPCQIFRAFPWTFPRACNDESDFPENKVISVQTTDLLHSCPTWSCTAPAAFPLRRAMRAFRERWSHRRVLVAAPEERDPGDLLITTALWGCETDLVWRVIGGSKFLAELRGASYGPPEFPESLPEFLGPAQRPDSLFLCRHEIRVD
jgi:hypothetical protein